MGKNAIYTGADWAIHQTAERLKNVRWRDLEDCGAPEDTWEWYYAEERLYVIRHKKTKACIFIEAGSPAGAFDKLRRQFRG